MAAHLNSIASAEGFEAEEPALWEISRNADGALRDAISMTEQALAMGSGRVSSDAVRAMLGGGSRAEMERLVSSLRTDPALSSAILKEILGRGVSPERFLAALYPVFRDMWVYSLWRERAVSGITTSPEELEFLRSEVPNWDPSELERACSSCAALFQKARWGLGLEVFSGLLLFDLLSTSGTVSPRAPVRLNAKDHKAVKPSAGAAPPDPVPTRPPAKAEEKTEVPDGTILPDLISRLLDVDLALCAALVDVRINLSGGEIAFDCSEASPLAKAMIDSKSSCAVISRALGRPSDDCQPDGGEAAVSAGARVLQKLSESASSPSTLLEEISSLMNADLLVLKSVSHADEQAMDGMEDPEQMHDSDDDNMNG
jgi:hypothetical protein